jgi:crotonobetainyl-CoA:carnitine CoA-transferase CaiB-like acyl-CoA transferase
MKSAAQALREVLTAAGVETETDARIDGADPVFPTRFLLGAAGAAAIAATGIAAADLWRLRGGRGQDVAVDIRAVAAALRSDRYLTIDGRPPPSPWAPISGFYQSADGRWLQFHCNFPHHRDGVLRILGCEDDREAVAAATAKWEAQKLEDVLAEAGMCAGMVRSRDEWQRHPQATAVAGLPLLEVRRIGDSPPEALPAASRPLAGVRALDLTRVLAGPVAMRTLAEHGADVMRVTAEHLTALPGADVDTGHGKLATSIDLRSSGGVETLHRLVREADVFCQAYRPGTLAARGFGPEDLARTRPGLVYATLSAYGHEGPWRDRRGFDSLVQTVSGIVDEESAGGPPRHLPAQALDYVSGYLLAFGTIAALARRSREGGSYLVRVSLAQTGRWLDSLGRAPEDALETPDPRPDEVESLFIQTESPFGLLRHVGPAARMSATPPRWDRPSVPLGYHPPAWPPR